LLISVLTAVGEQLQGQLAAALPAEPVPPVRLLALAWEAMQLPEADPLLRLYIEVSGLAARGREPYRGVAAAVAQGWLDWVAERLAVPLDERRVAASGVLAMLDGLLLVRFVASPEAAADAAGWLTGAWTAGP
jgi:predicted metal-binding membrane protein